MARELRSFSVTVPHGTQSVNPLITDLTMPVRIVQEIEIMMPPGPNGLVGFKLGSSGIPILPAGGDTWIVGNGEVFRWPLSGQIDSGAWQMIAYNTGVYDHTLQVRFLVDLVQVSTAVPAISPISIEDLNNAGSFAAIPVFQDTTP